MTPTERSGTQPSSSSLCVGDSVLLGSPVSQLEGEEQFAFATASDRLHAAARLMLSSRLSSDDTKST
jgi:hypothetical protein